MTAAEHAQWQRAGLVVVARGRASFADPQEMRGRSKSSYFADPVSWLVSASAEDAMDGCAALLAEVADAVATITVSDYCTLDTMRALALQAPRGRLSPLRFSGANPGSAGSLPAMTFGFKGPSLTLSMPPAHGLPTARLVAGSWLRQGLAAYVLISGHSVEAGGRHTVSTTIARGLPPDPDSPAHSP